MTETIHTHLAERDLLPGEQLLASGYVAADLLVTSQQDHLLDLLGPVLSDTIAESR